MRIVSIIYLLIIAFSLLNGAFSFRGREYNISRGLNKNNTDAVKGLLAIAVLFSHLAGHTSYHLPGFSFTVFGSIGVGCFFFLSGYGLIKASKSRDFFEGYLRRHISKLFLPFFIMLITWGMVFQIVLREPMSSVLHAFATGNPVSNSWYIFASFYCYFLFWEGRKKGFWQMQSIVLWGIVIWIFSFSVVLKWPDWWYKTIVCFYIGIFWGKYSRKICDFVQQYYVLLVTISTLSVFAAYTIPAWFVKIIKVRGNLLWLINDIALAISGGFFMASVLEKANLQNSVTILLGKISFYLYLIHGLIIRLTDTVLPKWGTTDTPMIIQEFVSTMVVIVSVVLSLVMTVMTDRIRSHKR